MSWHSCFILGRFRVQISVREPTIPSDILCSFYTSLQTTSQSTSNRAKVISFHILSNSESYNSTLYRLSCWQYRQINKKKN